MSELEEFSRALRSLGRELIAGPMRLMERFLDWIAEKTVRW